MAPRSPLPPPRFRILSILSSAAFAASGTHAQTPNCQATPFSQPHYSIIQILQEAQSTGAIAEDPSTDRQQIRVSENDVQVLTLFLEKTNQRLSQLILTGESIDLDRQKSERVQAIYTELKDFWQSKPQLSKDISLDKVWQSAVETARRPIILRELGDLQSFEEAKERFLRYFKTNDELKELFNSSVTEEGASVLLELQNLAGEMDYLPTESEIAQGKILDPFFSKPENAESLKLEQDSHSKTVEELRIRWMALSQKHQPPIPGKSAADVWSQQIVKFKAQREVERLRYLLRENHLRKESREPDYDRIQSHPGYAALETAVQNPLSLNGALPLDANERAQSLWIFQEGNSPQFKTKHLSLVARRQEAWFKLGGEEGFKNLLDQIRDKLYLERSENGPNPLLSPQDIPIDEILQSHSQLQELVSLNNSLEIEAVRSPFLTREGLRDLIFQTHVEKQIEKARSHQTALAEYAEARSSHLEQTQQKQGLFGIGLEAFESAESKKLFADLLNKQGQHMAYLKRVLPPQQYDALQQQLNRLDLDQQALRRLLRHQKTPWGVHTSRFSGFDQSRVDSIIKTFEDLKLYTPNETNREKDKMQSWFISSLSDVSNPDWNPPSLESLAEKYGHYFKDLPPEERDLRLKKMQEVAIQIHWDQSKELLRKLESSLQIVEESNSVYRVHQSKDREYLVGIKKEIQRNLGKHFPADQVEKLASSVRVEVAVALAQGRTNAQIAQEASSDKDAQGSFVSHWAASVGNSIVDQGEKLSMAAYAPLYTVAFPFRAAWAGIRGKPIDGFAEGLAYDLEGIQRISNEHPLRGNHSTGSFLNTIEDRNMAGVALELGLSLSMARYAPIFSLAAEPLFQAPELLTRHVIYRGALNLSDQDLHELRKNGDATVLALDGASAATQAAIGLGLMMGGRPSMVVRGRQVLTQGIKTPASFAKIKAPQFQILTPRIGPISDKQALWAGRAVTVGGSVGVATALSAPAVLAMETYYSDLEDREFNLTHALSQTVTGVGTSLLYMGAVRTASQAVARGHFGQALPENPAHLKSPAELALYQTSMQKAQAMALRIDIAEGLLDMPGMLEMTLEAYDAGSSKRFLAALTATGTVLYDSFGEQITVQGMRDGLYLFRKPFAKGEANAQQSIPLFVPDSEGNSQQYLEYRANRLSALYDTAVKLNPSLSPAQMRVILDSTERARQELSNQQRQVEFSQPSDFSVEKIYPAETLERARAKLIQSFQQTGLSEQAAKELVRFAGENHLLDSYR